MRRDVIEILLLVLVSCGAAALMTPSYIPGFVGAIPMLLGIVLAAMISLLAIIAALSSPIELAALSGRHPANDVHQYQAFIRSARKDIAVVFWCTVVSIAFYILAGIPTPLASYYPWLNQSAIRVPVIGGVAGLWLSVSATWDILQSLFVLQEARYVLFAANKRQE